MSSCQMSANAEELSVKCRQGLWHLKFSTGRWSMKTSYHLSGCTTSDWNLNLKAGDWLESNLQTTWPWQMILDVWVKNVFFMHFYLSDFFIHRWHATEHFQALQKNRGHNSISQNMNRITWEFFWTCNHKKLFIKYIQYISLKPSKSLACDILMHI